MVVLLLIYYLYVFFMQTIRMSFKFCESAVSCVLSWQAPDGVKSASRFFSIVIYEANSDMNIHKHLETF